MTFLFALLAFAVQDPVQEDIDNLIKLLDDKDKRYTEMQRAKEEIISIGRRATSKLTAELKKADQSPRLKRTLCEILGEIRHSSDEVVDALVAKLKDDDEFGTTIAAAAAWALGRLGDDRVVPHLVEALKSRETQTDKLLKYACIYWLGIMRAQPAADAIIPALEDLKNTSDDEWGHNIAAAACDALRRIRAKSAVDKIAEVLEQTKQDPFTQEQIGLHAARAIAVITGEDHGKLFGDRTEVTASLQNWRNWGKQRVTQARIDEIAAAVAAFKKDQDKYPSVLLQLKVRPSTVKTWPDKGYYQGELTDSWGKQFLFRQPGTGADFDIVSLGADSQKGGSEWNADIWNHDKWMAAKIEGTKTAVSKAAEAIFLFQKDMGRYPKGLGELRTKPADGGDKWKEPYVKDVPVDAWDNIINYTEIKTGEGSPFKLVSMGRDRKEGGKGVDADIVWDHEKKEAVIREDKDPK